ncbi:MAG TPA: hypothetical protein VGR28_09320 [Candidatus Thermoplasmatota archaeon]|jgi:hypothetical protein|nr:hypothetical protein [Candidatus Thermoplasmatota archaeon]
MGARDHVSMVCRDCGEVTQFPLPGLKPDAFVSCGACGLVVNAAQLRWPMLGLRPGPGALPPAEPAQGRPRPRPGPRLRR